jgi:ribonuclease P protein component
LPYNRICFTFSRKFGNAVVKNRARRLGREAYRLMKSGFEKQLNGNDIILLVYPENCAGKGNTLFGRQEQLKSLFLKAGLLK